jgi:hypothetical protein
MVTDSNPAPSCLERWCAQSRCATIGEPQRGVGQQVACGRRQVVGSAVSMLVVCAVGATASADRPARWYAGDGRFALGEVPDVSEAVGVAGLADGTVG